ncbi:MAG: glycosyltransferase family 4 protein [Planctomycetaceae bacterium]|nr:glycosyltransferase family 4 protein [Planctomycetaceae bacterium]
MQRTITLNGTNPDTLDDNQPLPLQNEKVFRVWAVTEYYFPNFSGAAIQAHQVLDRLAQQGHQVQVLTMADHASRKLVGSPRRMDGITVNYLPVINRFSRRWIPFAKQEIRSLNELFRRASFDFGVLWKLIWNGRRGDIVQFYVIGELTRLVMLFASLRGMRTVIQISLCGADDPCSIRSTVMGVSARMMRSCFHAAGCVVGLSTALTESCREFGLPPKAIARIPNGVALEKFQPSQADERDRLCESLFLSSEKRYIVFVGSAIYRKGIDVVVEAFVELASERQDIDLLIVGPCDFRDRTRHAFERHELVMELKSHLLARQLSNRVYWVGEVDNVIDYLRISEVFFFPTRREGLPNVVAEAMAAELPVVASHLQGVTTDLVESGIHGRLIHGHHPQPYVHALRELFRDDEKRSLMGLAAAQRAKREFDLTRIARQYEELYNGLLET